MNSILRLKAFLLCLLLLCFSAACDEDDPTTAAKVVSPAANQTFSIDYDYSDNGVVTITVEFSKPMNSSTLQQGETLILEGYRTVGASAAWQDIPHTANWSADFKVLTIRTNQPSGNWCSFIPDCSFRLRLIGTDAGEGVLQDADGNALDGNNDNAPGGNFETTFGILG